MMHQEKAASCTCLHVQPTWVAGHMLYQWQKNSPQNQNGKYWGLCKYKTLDITVAKNSFAVTCLSWPHFSELTAVKMKQWGERKNWSLKNWSVVYSITLKSILVPGEEAGFLQLVLFFSAALQNHVLTYLAVICSTAGHKRTEKKGFMHRTWAFCMSILMYVYDLAVSPFQIWSWLCFLNV